MNGGQFLKPVGWTVAVLIGLVILIPVLFVLFVIGVGNSFDHEVDARTASVTADGRSLDHMWLRSTGRTPWIEFVVDGCEYRQSASLPSSSPASGHYVPIHVRVQAANAGGRRRGGDACPDHVGISDVSLSTQRLVPIGTTRRPPSRDGRVSGVYELDYVPRTLMVEVTVTAQWDDQRAPMEFIVSYRSRAKFRAWNLRV